LGLEECRERQCRLAGVGQGRDQLDAGVPVDEDPDLEVGEQDLGKREPQFEPEVSGPFLVFAVDAEHRVVNLHRSSVPASVTI
jgi:hypothetical protein